jgi:lipopolysaccharide/colanic/teichoic acid biosynthesis glycosyltransferase
VIPPGIRFIGTVWIGAGQQLNPGDILVGPGGRPDAPGLETKRREIPWEDISMARGRLSRPRRHGRAGRVSKRLFDVACALVGLALTLPFYPLFILLIVIEDGWPPFFVHRRQTIRGREFPCYKFRSMCKAAEGMKAELGQDNVCDGPQFYIEDDPRLLKVGEFIRKFQIDELPQLFNVLVGHMSIVGPRPSPESENQFCPTWREARLSVRPGLTGLWQVRRTRRPQTDFQEWIRYDLEYLQHQSWTLDLWIIWQTFKRIVHGAFGKREEE